MGNSIEDGNVRATSRVEDHSTSRDKSFCRSKQSDWEETDIKHLASSAKSKTDEDERADGRSLINIRNKRGSRILPCGIPERTGSTLDLDWPTETYC